MKILSEVVTLQLEVFKCYTYIKVGEFEEDVLQVPVVIQNLLGIEDDLVAE